MAESQLSIAQKTGLLTPNQSTSTIYGPANPATGTIGGMGSSTVYGPANPATGSIGGLAQTPPPVTSGQILGASTSSGGGGGGAAQQLADIYSGKTTWSDPLIAELKRQIEGGATQDQRLIDEAYGASSNYLNQAEQALRGDYPTILSEIDAQRAAAQRTATTGKESTLGTIGEQQTLANQRNQNVMSDARRLYDELRRGYQQRFGGASSAGQAATELGNLEQQRQAGKTQQEYGNTMRQIETARTEVEKKFQDQIYQLEQTTNQAKNEAQRDFQNKLLQISQSRAANEQAKAQARLSALQDLRNKVYKIDLQNLQFQQTLAQQKQQQSQQLSDYASTISGYGTQATNAVGDFTSLPGASSNLQTGQTLGASTTNPYVGSVGKNDWLNGLGNLVGSILPGKNNILGIGGIGL